jgi:hypothetical protein
VERAPCRPKKATPTEDEDDAFDVCVFGERKKFFSFILLPRLLCQVQSVIINIEFYVRNGIYKVNISFLSIAIYIYEHVSVYMW